MEQPWAANVVLTNDDASTLISEQFPFIDSDRISLLGNGWDTTAFLVDDQFVFRFPRRQLGADCLQYETRVLPRLAARLPLPIPDPIYVGMPTVRFPWLFAGYRRLKGRTACSVAMNDQQRLATIPWLAEFLSMLHSITAEEGFLMSAPPDLLGRMDFGRRIPQTHQRIDKLADLGLLIHRDRYHSLIDIITANHAERSLSLVHGDLYLRHLLVDDDDLPCGIIDWGDVHVGDVALDLSIAFSFLPPNGRETFRLAYGAIDDTTWKRARFRAIHYGLILTEYAHSVNDADLLREAKWTLAAVLHD